MVALQHANGHSDVVEHGKAFAVIGKGVVRAARQVRGQPMLPGHKAGGEGALGGEARPAGQGC